MESCLFCKIASKQIPKEFIFEDDDIVAFNDIHPLAPTHVLIIPKKHIPTIDDLKDNDTLLAGKLIQRAKKNSSGSKYC